MTTPTPRTDAEALKWGPHEGQMNVVIPTSFARQLERELAAAQDDIAILRLTVTGLQDRAKAAGGRAEALAKAIAEARAVEFFHDGLSGDLLDCRDKASAYVLGYQEAFAAIDAAMKEPK